MNEENLNLDWVTADMWSVEWAAVDRGGTRPYSADFGKPQLFARKADAVDACGQGEVPVRVFVKVGYPK